MAKTHSTLTPTYGGKPTPFVAKLLRGIKSQQDVEVYVC